VGSSPCRLRNPKNKGTVRSGTSEDSHVTFGSKQWAIWGQSKQLGIDAFQEYHDSDTLWTKPLLQSKLLIYSLPFASQEGIAQVKLQQVPQEVPSGLQLTNLAAAAGVAVAAAGAAAGAAKALIQQQRSQQIVAYQAQGRGTHYLGYLAKRQLWLIVAHTV
jgi:hypothetical protein